MEHVRPVISINEHRKIYRINIVVQMIVKIESDYFQMANASSAHFIKGDRQTMCVGVISVMDNLSYSKMVNVKHVGLTWYKIR